MPESRLDHGLEAAVVRGQVCCYCESPDEVQADHVRPRHAGGQSIPVNLAPLCSACNRLKSCYWPGHGYHPLPGLDSIDAADAILDAEICWLREHHPESELMEHIWPWYGQPDGIRAAAELDVIPRQPGFCDLGEDLSPGNPWASVDMSCQGGQLTRGTHS